MKFEMYFVYLFQVFILVYSEVVFVLKSSYICYIFSVGKILKIGVVQKIGVVDKIGIVIFLKVVEKQFQKLLKLF